MQMFPVTRLSGEWIEWGHNQWSIIFFFSLLLLLIPYSPSHQRLWTCSIWIIFFQSIFGLILIEREIQILKNSDSPWMILVHHFPQDQISLLNFELIGNCIQTDFWSKFLTFFANCEKFVVFGVSRFMLEI